MVGQSWDVALMTFKFTSFSESGQDAFAYQQLGGRPGTFLDIGSGHPLVRSNSAGLEVCGWRGLCIDKNPEFASVWHLRRSPLIVVDALTFDWKTLDCFYVDNCVDYISLDVDSASVLVLDALIHAGVRFSCITIEHDGYTDQAAVRASRKLMQLRGCYDLHTADVLSATGLAYEDWWTAGVGTPFTQNFDRVTFTA